LWSCCLVVLLFRYSQVAAAPTCNIQDYGAKGDGTTDNTKAIQSALNACVNGGTVIIPTGTFLTYSLLVSGVTSYTIQVMGTLKAGTMDNWPVNGLNCEDFFTITKGNGVTITGNGVFDGQGTPWYIAFDQGTLKYTRPRQLVISDSSNVKISHVKLYNSPMMNLILNNIQGGEISYLNITDEWYNGGTTEPHNTDGIDVGTNSKNIYFHDLYIYNGDDSIAVKKGSTAGGCTSDLLIENCQFFRGHGASIGSIPSGCVQNVVFRNISINGQMAGCNLKSYGTEAGFIKNITWQDIKLINTEYCIHINGNYKPSFGDPQTPPLGDSVQVSDIFLTNIQGTNCHYPAVFNCEPTAPCENIYLDNVNVAAGATVKTMECSYAHGSVAGTIQPASCLQN